MALRARCLGAAAIALLWRVGPPFVQSPILGASRWRRHEASRPVHILSSTKLEEAPVQTKFADLALSDEGKAAMSQGFRYEALTDVQDSTFQPVLDGSNLLVRAKTGAGKTLSFLLPTMDRLHRSAPPPAAELAMLILSPVRELSMQIYAEASKLAEYFPTLKPVLMVGGSSWEEDVDTLDSLTSGYVVLVATPGRLQTHLDKTPGFRARLSRVQVLVLDEADQLAGELFGEVTESILSSLGPDPRQNLFYSATISEEVKQLIAKVAEQHTFEDMLAREDVSVPETIVQTYQVVPTEDMTTTFWRCVVSAKQYFQDVPPKIVAIFLTGRVAAYYAEAFRLSGVGLEVFEIHSRLKQQDRTEQSDGFRAAESGILFTSDVTSRGLDYPGVTAVIQVGAPDGRDEYIHRVGRTGRARSQGLGVLLLHEFERDFLDQLSDLQISESQTEAVESPVFSEMKIGTNVKAQAYYSRINHVLRHSEGRDVLEVFREGLQFATSIGALDKEGRPPPLTEQNAQRYGVADIEDRAVHISHAEEAPAVTISYQVFETEQLARGLLGLIGAQAAQHAKVVVIFINGDVAKLYAEMARQGSSSYEVYEAHSALSKKVRKKVAQSFGAASKGVLFTAGLSAATLPSEGVSAIIMAGLPASAKDFSLITEYVSKAGAAASLLLSAFEERALGALAAGNLVAAPAAVLEAGSSAPESLNVKLQAKAYFSWLRHYALHPLLEDKLAAVQEAKSFATAIGACSDTGEPPALAKRMLLDMGLEGVEDDSLNIADA